MAPLARILVLYSILGSIASSEVLEIRTIKASRETSTAIRNNLDEGNLPDDRFEAGYSKLVSERKIEELSRFLKNDMTSGNLITFETTAKDRWQSAIELEPTFDQRCCRMRCVVSTIAPGGKDPSQSPAISFNASATLAFNRWQVLGEMTFEADEILTLIKIGKPDAEAFPANVSILAFEGHLLRMDELRSHEIARLPAEKLEQYLSKTLSGHAPVDYFRYPIQSSQKATIWRSGGNHPQSKTVEKPIVQTESEAALSPDAKWAYVRILTEIGRSGGSGADYAFPFEDTIRVGEWTAVPAGRHPAGSSAILLIKVSNFHPSENKSQSSTERLKPLPDSGTVTRIYPDIHPIAWKKLSLGNLAPTKTLLTSNGVPDGRWSATLTSNALLVGNADVSIHRRIEALLVDFTWEKEIAKKTQISR